MLTRGTFCSVHWRSTVIFVLFKALSQDVLRVSDTDQTNRMGQTLRPHVQWSGELIPSTVYQML